MVHTCFLCKWRSDKKPKRSFHVFPSDKGLQQKWLNIIGKSDAVLSKSASLCSWHFENTCFRYGLVYGRECLKAGSLPSLNLTNNIDSSKDIVQNRKRNENEISPSSLEFHSLPGNCVQEISIASPSKDNSISEVTYRRSRTSVNDGLPHKKICCEKIILTESPPYLPNVNPSSDTVVNSLNSKSIVPPSKESPIKRSGTLLNVNIPRSKVRWTNKTINDFILSPVHGELLLENIKEELFSKNKKILSLKREVRRLRQKIMDMKSVGKDLHKKNLLQEDDAELLQDMVQQTQIMTQKRKCESCDISLPSDCPNNLTESTKCQNCSLIGENNMQAFTLDTFQESTTISDNDEKLIPIEEHLEIIVEEDNEDDDHMEQNEITEINEGYNGEGEDPPDRVKFQDKIISIGYTDEVLSQFKENNIDIDFYNTPRTHNAKRLLLIGQELVQCPDCKLTFSSDKNFKDHFLTEHGNTELPTLKSNKFLKFIDTPSRELVSLCPICNINMFTAKLLKKHLSNVHNNCQPYRCEKCSKCFGSNYAYTAHLKKIQNFGTCFYHRKCHVCSELVTTKSDYLRHSETHQSFICDECGSVFVTEHNLKLHSAKHRNKKDKHQLCTVCGIFVRRLQCHMETHEKRIKNYMCHKCPKLFFVQTSLRKHIRNVHLQSEKFECLDCNKEYNTADSLKQHNMLKHSKVHRFSCKICEQEFDRIDNFRRHMKKHWAYGVHVRGGMTGLKYKRITKSDAPKCKYCSKTCNSVSALRIHLLTHIRHRRYKCKFCSFTFSDITSKYRHQRKHKDPSFDLSCRICWGRMKTKEDLEKHLETHEKSKKYKCDSCEESFARQYLLSHHISEKHTNEEELRRIEKAILDDALEEFLL